MRWIAREVEFFIDGDPVGYTIAMARRDPRVKRYHAYCERVRMVAMQGGVTLPIEATESTPVYVYTQAVFARRRFPDPENVHKGIKDALFYQRRLAIRGRGDDRWTGGQYEAPAFAETPADVGVWVRLEWATDPKQLAADLVSDPLNFVATGNARRTKTC
jgi:hypothetical protein